MKINRVILSSTFNELYYPFWNPLSKLYKVNFKIEPTLIFLGTEEELKQASLSEEHGKIIRQDIIQGVPAAWTSTWALFYFAHKFPDDVSIIMGIDQIPLSNLFLKHKVQGIPDNAYAQLIADAYLPHHWSKEESASPTGYHVAKGSTFHEVHGFSPTFEEEIQKIVQLKIEGFWVKAGCGGDWGMDESYAARNVRKFQDKSRIVSMDLFGELCQRRLECCRTLEVSYDMEKLHSGYYSECHACRPLTQHRQWLTTLMDNVPVCL